MAEHGSRANRELRRETLASKTGVSQKALSGKIAKVKRDDPELSNSQAAGKAGGILKARRKG